MDYPSLGLRWPACLSMPFYPSPWKTSWTCPGPTKSIGKGWASVNGLAFSRHGTVFCGWAAVDRCMVATWLTRIQNIDTMYTYHIQIHTTMLRVLYVLIHTFFVIQKGQKGGDLGLMLEIARFFCVIAIVCVEVLLFMRSNLNQLVQHVLHILV